jgi:proline-specific peptidase
MKEFYTKINDVRISYNIQGDGYPLFLLHGFAMYKEFWKWQAEVLSKNFKVITLDSRGCGKTDHPVQGFSMEILADDVKSLMDFLNIDIINLGGHSFGGMIAQQFALKYPDNLNKLILMSTFANLPLDKSGLEMYKQSQLSLYEAKIKDPNAAFWDKMKQRFSRDSYKEMIRNPTKQFNNLFTAKELIELENTNGTSKAQDILNMINAIVNHNTLKRLYEIMNETLVLAADKDRVVSKISSEILHERIPNSKLFILKSSHFFMLEEAPEVNDLILNFLKT